MEWGGREQLLNVIQLSEFQQVLNYCTFSAFFLLFCLFFICLKYFKIHPDIIVTEELYHELGQVPSEFPFLIGNEGTEKKKTVANSFRCFTVV